MDASFPPTQTSCYQQAARLMSKKASLSVALRGCLPARGSATSTASRSPRTPGPAEAASDSVQSARWPQIPASTSIGNTHWGILSSHSKPVAHNQPEEHHMCSPARCQRCGKTTWSGCGSHVDSVMASVAPAQRCTCAPIERPARKFPWSRS